MVQCKLCGSRELIEVLNDRPDYEFNVAQKLKYWKCSQPSCGLVFAAPLPTNEEIASFYQQYATHSPNMQIRFLLMISYLYRKSYIKQLRRLFDGTDLATVKVLDFGCGNGNLMKDLRQVGVKNQMGYDFDALACKAAAREGLVAVDSKAKMQQRSPFDFIFLNHVVEHLSDPQGELAYLTSLLNVDGKIIIRTPNTNSFLAALFGKGWRGWETPRHLHLFNNCNIQLLFPGLLIQKNATSNYIFSGVFNESFHSKFFRRNMVGKLLRKAMFLLIVPVSLIVNALFHNKGEEIYLIAQKKV